MNNRCEDCGCIIGCACGEVGALFELDDMRKLNAQLLAACEAVEWVRTWDRDGQAMRRCPWCNVFYYERLSRIDWQHAPDCQLAAAIKAAKGQA